MEEGFFPMRFFFQIMEMVFFARRQSKRYC